MRPWHLGNTTVRSPFRLRDGLIALSKSPLLGNLRGQANEKKFRALLGEARVVSLGQDKTYSVSRKWRSALGKLGFLYPEKPKKSPVSQADIGPFDKITPNGQRLIDAQSVPAMQECFLRSLAAYYIPSSVEPKYPFSTFSPLRHTLRVMLELERRTQSSLLNFIEMGLIVQMTSRDDDLAGIVDQILESRTKRDGARNKRQFDGTERAKAAKLHGYKEQTFNDYADTNFRYLKATGLVQSKGRGLTITPEQHVFVEKLVEYEQAPVSPLDYFRGLCEGARLPTDDKGTAKVVLADLIKQTERRAIPFDLKGRPLNTPAQIASVRFEIEELIRAKNEIEYADRQASAWEEIAAYMSLLISRKRSLTFKGEEIQIPSAEAPAYFEWIMWRAFLAIDSLVNPPSKSRGFSIDQDFRPVGSAPGRAPDLTFEFANFVVVVEVTLTDNSRQEAAEGETVRRHVADRLREYGQKPVYGLFVANRIDINTAETFRLGSWYVGDEQITLNIVPLTLEQFLSFFKAMFDSKQVEVNFIRELLDSCNALRAAHTAPNWKREINRIIEEKVKQL